MKIKYRLLGAITSLFLLCSQANAIGFVQGSFGNLAGAVGVNVNGHLYDVYFQDGTFESLGLNTASNPFLNSLEEARDASQALFEQVFVGLYASGHTNYINGCGDDGCGVMTTAFPYTQAQGSSIGVPMMRNNLLYLFNQSPFKYFERISEVGLANTLDTSNGNFSGFVFAVWSEASVNPPVSSPIPAIPEPQTYALLLVGIGIITKASKAKHIASVLL